MSKKNFDKMIRENQKLNHINLRMFAVASKSTAINSEIDKSTKNKKKMNNNRKFKESINMALSAGKQTTEGGSFKMYTGLTPMGCKYVCPTKEQLSQITGREWSKDMTYTKTTDEGIQQVNLAFPLTINTKVDGEDVNIMVLQNIAIWNAPRIKTDGSKFQVVDKWGNFAWVTNEEYNNHTTPVSTSGKKLKVDASNWRKAYRGEENLMKFLKPRLNIEDAFEYKNNEWVLKANHDACECRLDNISKYFTGDVSEIQNALNIMPENKVKGFLYVTEYEGKQRQAVAREYINLASSNKDAIKAEIQNINNNNGTNFTFSEELKEYKVESTQFTPSNEAMPTPSNPFEGWN